jgi:hypothetical protein
MTAYSFLGFCAVRNKPARFMAKQFVRPVALKITDHNFLWTEVVMPIQLVKNQLAQ